MCQVCRLPRRRPAVCSEACSGVQAELKRVQRLTAQNERRARARDQAKRSQEPASDQARPAPSTADSAPDSTSALKHSEPSRGKAIVLPAPQEESSRQLDLPTSFYTLAVFQGLATLLLGLLLYYSLGALHELGGALGGGSIATVNATQSAQPAHATAPGPAPYIGDTADTAPASQSITGQPTTSEKAGSDPGSPTLDLPAGETVRGEPVRLIGTAPYGEIVALVDGDEVLAVTRVNEHRFRFDDVVLKAGQNLLHVVAYSRNGPALESLQVTIHYERLAD